MQNCHFFGGKSGSLLMLTVYFFTFSQKYSHLAIVFSNEIVYDYSAK